jgi:hypothetical protein
MIPTDREVEIYEYWKEGRTLQEVGNKYGCTRERIRQILNRSFGLTGMDNIEKTKNSILAIYLKKKDLAIENRYSREMFIYKVFGCHEEIVAHINKGKFHQKEGGVANDYYWQRHHSSCRGIKWEISLPEWWQIWKESGKYPVRGKHLGEYVMSRYGDHGPYHKDNVHICLAVDNIKEYYQLTPKEEVSRRIQDGKKRNRLHELQATA